MKLVTVTYLVTPTSVWLARKLQGPAPLIGKLFGYGGKVKTHLSETSAAGAVRETREEGKVGINPKSLCRITCIDFYEEKEHLFACDVFLATSWIGIPQATDEMGCPGRFPRYHLPLEEMMKGDAYWLPEAMKGRVIPDGGFVRYSKNLTEVIDYSVPIPR